jgi:hypothetical protein
MTENDGTKKTIFNSMSRNTQVVFVGLLAGILLISIYMIGVGLLASNEKPTILSSGKLSLSTYPLSYQYNEYSKKSEMEIYNDGEWDVNRVWVGSSIEYDAYKNNKLMTSDKHVFNGPFKTSKSFDYKITLNSFVTQNDIVVEINGGGSGKMQTCVFDKNGGCRVEPPTGAI